MRKVKKLTQQIEKRKQEIEDIRQEIADKKTEVDKKGRTGLTPAAFEDFKQKCSRKIKDKDRSIRRKELARQARLKKLKEKEDNRD